MDASVGLMSNYFDRLLFLIPNHNTNNVTVVTWSPWMGGAYNDSKHGDAVNYGIATNPVLI